MAKDPVYTISSTPAAATRLAATIPGALAALASQLVHQLPDGPVPWKITDLAGTDHRHRHTQRAGSICWPSPSTNSSATCTPSCTGPQAADHVSKRHRHPRNDPQFRAGCDGVDRR